MSTNFKLWTLILSIVTFGAVLIFWDHTVLSYVSSLMTSKPMNKPERFPSNALRSEESKHIPTPVRPFKIGVGIFSVERTDAPDYLYIEVASMLDSLLMDSQHIDVDKIHVFDGTYNRTGSQTKFLKYFNRIDVHPMDLERYSLVEGSAVHRKASLNYLLALEYLVGKYDKIVDAYLILEDDLVFSPDSAYNIWRILNHLKNSSNFLVDGYAKGQTRTIEEEKDPSLLIRYHGELHCCSQAFLLSPTAAKLGIPQIQKSLNGAINYLPLDLLLTSSLFKTENFEYYFPAKCFVQHIGLPHLGLGKFHRGCSRMEFEG